MKDDCNICGKPLSEHRDGLACCPFCGQPGRWMRDTTKTLMGVCCTKRAAFCPSPVIWREMGLDAVKRWNGRPETVAERELAAAKALLAECREALNDYVTVLCNECYDYGLRAPKPSPHPCKCERNRALLAKLEAMK